MEKKKAKNSSSKELAVTGSGKKSPGKELAVVASSKTKLTERERIERKVEGMKVAPSKKDPSSILYEVTASIQSSKEVFGYIETTTDSEIVISTQDKQTPRLERILLNDVFEIASTGKGKPSRLKVRSLVVLSKYVGTVSVDGNLITVKTADKLSIQLNSKTCEISVVEAKEKK